MENVILYKERHYDRIKLSKETILRFFIILTDSFIYTLYFIYCILYIVSERIYQCRITL